MKKVLIVEDEKILREALAIKFKDEGFEVLEAGNGEIGLELALKSSPDIILLDIVMPVMDGLTMLKKLQDDEVGKYLKVLILTNLSDGNKIADAIDDGSRGYLIKTDWSLDEIVEKVRGLVS